MFEHEEWWGGGLSGPRQPPLLPLVAWGRQEVGSRSASRLAGARGRPPGAGRGWEGHGSHEPFDAAPGTANGVLRTPHTAKYSRLIHAWPLQFQLATQCFLAAV